jgi:hypothetical protein
MNLKATTGPGALMGLSVAVITGRALARLV